MNRLLGPVGIAVVWGWLCSMRSFPLPVRPGLLWALATLVMAIVLQRLDASGRGLGGGLLFVGSSLGSLMVHQLMLAMLALLQRSRSRNLGLRSE